MDFVGDEYRPVVYRGLCWRLISSGGLPWTLLAMNIVRWSTVDFVGDEHRQGGLPRTFFGDEHRPVVYCGLCWR